MISKVSNMRLALYDAFVRSLQRRHGRVRWFVVDLLSTTPIYTRYLVAHLLKQSQRVSLVASSPHRDPTYFQRAGLVTNQGIIDVVARSPRWALNTTWVRRGLKLVEYHINVVLLVVRVAVQRPELVHTQWLATRGTFPIDKTLARALTALGTAHVHTVHNVTPHDNPSRRLVSAQGRIYSSANALICHTEGARAQLVAEFGISSEKIWVIPHGPMFADIPKVSRRKARDHFELPQERRVVLFHGVLRPYKGIEFLLDAWDRAGVDDAVLVIAGNGEKEYVEYLADAIRRTKRPDSIIFKLGYLPDAEVPILLRAADVIAFPYIEVTQSGSLMAALPVGAAIVATDVGGFGEVLQDGMNGLLVPYGNAADFSSALRRLLNDRALRDRLARGAAAAFAELPSWDAIARRTIECYKAATLPVGSNL